MKPSTSSPEQPSALKRSDRFFQNKLIRILLPAVFWLAVWYGAAEWVDMELLVPTPVSVLTTLRELVVTWAFWQSAGLSLLRIFCGTLAGVVLGTLLAILTERFRLAELLLAPAIRVIRTIPVASFIILVLLWVTTGRVPGVISALIVLPILWQSVTTGLQSVDRELLELAGTYRMSRGRQLRYLYLPAVRPHFNAGISNAIGLAWKSGVAAEVLCLPKKAIGTQVYFSKLYLETPSLFAWTIVVIILSLLLETLVRLLLREGGRT